MAKSKDSVDTGAAEEFEVYLFEMDDVLETFIGEFGNTYTLDYSEGSLGDLERLHNERGSQGPETAREQLKNRSARYLGEVFRKNVGGHWRLCTGDPKQLFFNLPVVAGYASMDLEFCPIEVISNYLFSKRSGLLKTAVESHKEFIS